MRKTCVRWNEDEIESLAMKFVELRLKDPFGETKPLLSLAQETTLVPEKRRNISPRVCPELKDRIKAIWEKQQAPTMVQQEPTVIEIEVEKIPPLADIATRMDFPTVCALFGNHILRHFGRSEETPKPHIPAPATNGTAAPKPPISILTPPPPQNNKLRILYCSEEGDTFSQIETECKKYDLPVDLRWLNLEGKRKTFPLSCDYVLFPQNATNGYALKAAKGRYNDDSIYIVLNGPRHAVQKIRDICSLKNPMAIK